MTPFRVQLLGRASMCSLTSQVAAKVPKPGQVGPKPGDLVPSLAALIPEAPVNKKIKASGMPWVKESESFFETWKKVSPCMPKYAEFLALHKAQGLPVEASQTQGGKAPQGFAQDRERVARHTRGGKVANDEIVAALGKFYLHVALQLRPEEVEKAGDDDKELLKVAQKTAEEDFEPFIDAARELVSDYDPKLHKALEETSPWYEVDDGLFWQANFDIAAPAPFLHFLTAVGHGSGQGRVGGKAHTSPEDVSRQVKLIQEGLNGDDPSFEPARRAAEVVYTSWLQASSMPVKGDIKKILSENGLIVTEAVHDANRLMPDPA